MQIQIKKDKNREPYWWLFRRSKSDSDSNDKTKSDIDNDEYYE